MANQVLEPLKRVKFYGLTVEIVVKKKTEQDAKNSVAAGVEQGHQGEASFMVSLGSFPYSAQVSPSP